MSKDPKPATSNDVAPTRRRPWPLIVSGVIAAAAAAGSLTLAGPTILHGKQIAGMATANAADVIAVKAERKAAMDAFMLASLEAEVRLSMQQYFDDPSNSRGASFDVVTVHLIKVSDNKYEGMATMSANGGAQRDISVHVTADERNMMWSTDPGGLLPLFR